MKEVKIIGLSGHIGSGKDFIASIAEKQFGYKHLKLAGLIKHIYCQIYGVTIVELEDRFYKEIARPKLIDYGEKMKEVDLYCHCKYVYNQILLSLPEKTKFIISDMRWPFESLYFRKLARCTKTQCEIDHISIPGYQVTYKSLYIESDLADKSSRHDSESHYQYFKDTKDGLIINGTEQRYNRNNDDLINQLIKFV